jgi:CheY-like chemotaxis protein
MHDRTAIVLVEDSPADVYLFREALKAHTVDVDLVVFEDGEAALSFMLDSEHDGPEPQLFVLDLNLPKVDGLTLLRHLRESARFRNSLVMVLTSSNNPDDCTAALNLGANRFLRKAEKISDFLDLGREIKLLLRHS